LLLALFAVARGGLFRGELLALKTPTRPIFHYGDIGRNDAENKADQPREPLAEGEEDDRNDRQVPARRIQVLRLAPRSVMCGHQLGSLKRSEVGLFDLSTSGG
jgi:hypothetical protein